MKSVAALIREGHSLADAAKKANRKKRTAEKAAVEVVEAIEEVEPEAGEDAAD